MSIGGPAKDESPVILSCEVVDSALREIPHIPAQVTSRVLQPIRTLQISFAVIDIEDVVHVYL